MLAGGVAQAPSAWARAAHQPVFLAFLLCFAFVWGGLMPGVSLTRKGRWLEVVFWLLATATSLVGLARRLPGQNVLMSAALVAALSFGIAVVAEKTGFPFGPRTYTDALGGRIFGVPWLMPALWVLVIVNGRGVARLILRPWRQATHYGFWVIGLTCLLTVQLDAGLEPFAARAKHYWTWETRAGVLSWYSAPWVNFLAWPATSLGILGLITPWLINKQPVQQPTDYHPLGFWLLLNFYFATGNALQQLWPAVAFSLLANAFVTVCAVRGARW